MALINRFSIKSRLMALLLLVSMGSLLATGILSWWRFKNAFEKSVFAQITGIRTARSNQIEAYMQTLRNQIEILSEDGMVVAAMVELNSSYKELQNQSIPTKWQRKIETYYTKEFFPKLNETIQGNQSLINYRPTTPAAQYLQYHYIADNSFPRGKKKKLTDAQDGSDYSQYHSEYHPFFNKLTEKFGYYDLLLIDFETEEIIYSVDKDTDYATSLEKGPYRRSNLATVVSQVKDNLSQGVVQVVDFKPYTPSYGEPNLFFAAPIYNGTHVVGILAASVPVEEINGILTGDENWQEDGLGKTGEVYLVGSDLLMRSISRFLLQTPKAYEADLRDRGLSDSNINLIKQLKTSILLQPVDNKASQAAIAGVAGTTTVDDYRGVKVLSSHEGLKIDGLEWGIVAQVDRQEVFKPLYTLQGYLVILAAIIILLIIWFANFAGQHFIKPIYNLIDATNQFREGKSDVKIQQERGDEIGDLEKAFNLMLQDMGNKTALVEEKKQENQALLLNIVPDTVVARIKQGEETIADFVPQATILSARLFGLNELTKEQSATEIAAIFNQLIDAFDDSSQQYGLEKQHTVGTKYIAVCGLSRAYLDHGERTVSAANQMLAALEEINTEYGINLTLQIGIHSGPVMAGIIGTEKFTYKLWGETVNIAANLNYRGGQNSILVTQPVRESVIDQYLFVPHEAIEVEDLGEFKTWMLVTLKGGFSQQVELVQNSFTQLRKESNEFGQIFYEQLYELAPTARSLFQGEMAERQGKLMQILQGAVNGLNNLEELIPRVQGFGRSYVSYRIQEKDYEMVGEALYKALAQKLGQDFTPEVKRAWISIYKLLSSVLREAAISTSVQGE